MSQQQQQQYILGDFVFNCEMCIPCFENGKDKCKGCDLDFSVFNTEVVCILCGEECEENIYCNECLTE